MPCGSPPQLVHIRTAAYPRARCAACDRRLTPADDEAIEGAFPLSTPACMVLIRARVCALCLADPALKDAWGVSRLALAIVRRLANWYANPPAKSAARAGSEQMHAHEPGRPKRRPRALTTSRHTAAEADA
jgi:hypothetical protein